MNLRFMQLAVAVSVGLAVTASALADDKLVVTGTDSKQAQISLKEISQITFSGDKMIIATANSGDNEFQIKSVDNIAFDLSASAIDDIEVALKQDVALSVQGGILSVTAPAGVPLSVAVYNLKGMLVASQKGFESLSIDFNSMATGVYIVRANDKTIKFTR